MPGEPTELRARATARQIWAVSLPIIFAAVSEAIVDVTDTIFLGRFGVTELGAVGLADAIYEVLLVVPVGLAAAVQVIAGRRAGEGNRRAIGHTFNQGLALMGVVSVAVFLAIRFGSPWLTEWVVGSAAVRTAVDDFLRIAAFAVLFDGINFVYGAFYVSIGRTRVLVGATVVLALTNVVLDWGLIFGNLGLPRMGIGGAALASVIAEAGSCAFITLWAWRKRDIRGYGLLSLESWDRRLTGRLASISSPVALETLVHSGRWFLFFLIIESLGEIPLASANIIHACYVVFLIPVEGLSETACTMVSNVIGQGKASRIGVLLRKVVWLGYLATAPFLVLALVFPRAVLAVFTSDQATIDGSVTSLVVVVLAILAAIPGEFLLSAVVGTGDTRGALVIESILAVIVLAYAYATASLGLSVAYVWSSVIAGWVLRVVLAYPRLRSQAWRDLEV